MTIDVIFQEALRSHSFSPTQQIQIVAAHFRSPACGAGGSKLGHSCGPVASKEDAGLKPSAYTQTHRDARARKMPGSRHKTSGPPQTRGPSTPLRIKKRGATCKPTRKQTGESASLQRLDHNHENQQNQRCRHLETTRRCSGAAAVPYTRRARRLFTSSAA